MSLRNLKTCLASFTAFFALLIACGHASADNTINAQMGNGTYGYQYTITTQPTSGSDVMVMTPATSTDEGYIEFQNVPMGDDLYYEIVVTPQYVSDNGYNGLDAFLGETTYVTWPFVQASGAAIQFSSGLIHMVHAGNAGNNTYSPVFNASSPYSISLSGVYNYLKNSVNEWSTCNSISAEVDIIAVQYDGTTYQYQDVCNENTVTISGANGASSQTLSASLQPNSGGNHFEYVVNTQPVPEPEPEQSATIIGDFSELTLHQPYIKFLSVPHGDIMYYELVVTPQYVQDTVFTSAMNAQAPPWAFFKAASTPLQFSSGLIYLNTATLTGTRDYSPVLSSTVSGKQCTPSAGSRQAV